jgi:hypothetical protein
MDKGESEQTKTRYSKRESRNTKLVGVRRRCGYPDCTPDLHEQTLLMRRLEARMSHQYLHMDMPTIGAYRPISQLRVKESVS